MNLDNNENELLLSIHIYKTAGLTFHSIIDRQFSRDELLYPSIQGISRIESQLKKGDDSNILKYKLVHGHFPFGWHKYFNRPFRYITFLRNPVSRVVSDYKYNKKFSGGHNHQYAANMTIEEYIDCHQLLDMDNGMTRFIAGDFQTPFGQLTMDTYNQALYNIDTYFAFVGITERFDDSLLLLGDLLDWKKVYYESKNVTKKTEVVLDEDVINKIRNNNQYDLLLYTYCCKRFAIEFSEIDNLKYKKFVFDLLNTMYNYIHPVYRRMILNS